MSIYDSMLTAGAGAARQEGDRFVAAAVKAVEDPLKTEVLGLTAKLSTAQTALEDAAIERTQLEKTIEALKAQIPGVEPTRPTVGTPGKVTNISTIADANAVSGRHIVGPLKFLSGATEADIVDVTADISEGTYTSTVNVIQVDAQAIFGRFKITKIKIAAARPSPYFAGGIGGQNLIVSDFDISGTIDGFKLNSSDAIVSNGVIHDLSQYEPGTPGVQHADGSHNEAFEVTSMRSLEIVDVRVDLGERTVAGSHSGLMVLGTVPGRLRSVGNFWSAAVPWNVVNDGTIAGLEVAGDRFARGPVGPYPTPTSAVWAGESIIAKTTVRTHIQAALTAGKSALIGGGAVTVKKG